MYVHVCVCVSYRTVCMKTYSVASTYSKLNKDWDVLSTFNNIHYHSKTFIFVLGGDDRQQYEAVSSVLCCLPYTACGCMHLFFFDTVPTQRFTRGHPFGSSKLFHNVSYPLVTLRGTANCVILLTFVDPVPQPLCIQPERAKHMRGPPQSQWFPTSPHRSEWQFPWMLRQPCQYCRMSGNRMTQLTQLTQFKNCDGLGNVHVPRRRHKTCVGQLHWPRHGLESIRNFRKLATHEHVFELPRWGWQCEAFFAATAWSDSRI